MPLNFEQYFTCVKFTRLNLFSFCSNFSDFVQSVLMNVLGCVIASM